MSVSSCPPPEAGMFGPLPPPTCSDVWAKGSASLARTMTTSWPFLGKSIQLTGGLGAVAFDLVVPLLRTLTIGSCSAGSSDCCSATTSSGSDRASCELTVKEP